MPVLANLAPRRRRGLQRRRRTSVQERDGGAAPRGEGTSWLPYVSRGIRCLICRSGGEATPRRSLGVGGAIADQGGAVMSDIPVRRELELVIEPHNDEYGRDDDRWRAQVATLHQELQARVDTVSRGRLVPGTKGTIDQLIVALGSAGAFTATVECFRAWLGRDKNRRIDVRWDEDGVERYVTFQGDAVDSETVREIARAAAARVGGPAWPAGTEPS
jgi:hypothetical protein